METPADPTARAEGASEEPAEPARLGPRNSLLLWVLFAVVAFPLYDPALSGPLHGDDYLYLNQPFMQTVSGDTLAAILDPFGDPAIRTTNYAPVHLYAHVLQGVVLGGYDNLRAMHSVNVVLHALNATLLAALFNACAIPLGLSIAAGLLFLVHPANVEAVAWVTQLKTLLAFAFGMTALLLHGRRPALGVVAFALALLSKPIAVCVLPAALLLEWVDGYGPEGRGRHLGWLGAWALVFLLSSLPAFGAFQHANQFYAGHVVGMERFFQAVAIVGRYAVLALTGRGGSISHEPDPPESLLDPWFLGGSVALAVVVWVCVQALRRRHAAVPWLALAAAAYAPVAQVFPFRYPMADRYLYFVLAGLLGAAATAIAPRLGSAFREWRASETRSLPPVLIAAAVGVAALALVLGVQTQRRAQVWRSLTAITTDAAMNYPNGTQAALLRGIASINRGDPNGALDALEDARARGYVEVNYMLSDPAWASLHGHPRFVNLVHSMARWWIAQWAPLESPIQLELADLGQMYLIVGELENAERTFERALATKGSADPAALQAALDNVRRLRAVGYP